MRIPYVAGATSGELHLADVRAGDLVQFMSDFHKHGIRVRADEIGRVLKVAQEDMAVSTIGTRRVADGGEEHSAVEIVVTPRDVRIVLDARDSRLGGTPVSSDVPTATTTTATAHRTAISIRQLLPLIDIVVLVEMETSAQDMADIDTVREALARASVDVEQDILEPEDFGYARRETLLRDLAAAAGLLGITTQDSWTQAIGSLVGPLTPFAGEEPTEPTDPAEDWKSVQPASPPTPSAPPTEVAIPWQGPQGSTWVVAAPGQEVYHLPSGKRGRITAVTSEGRLRVLVDDAPNVWDPKDVRLHFKGDPALVRRAPESLIQQRRRRPQRKTETAPGTSASVTEAEPARRGLATLRVADLDKDALGGLGIREMQQYLDRPEQFAVLSAYKSDRSKSQNQTAHGRLMAALQSAGFGPSQLRVLRGQYFADGGQRAEQSILVFDMDLVAALTLAAQFGQESVIYKSPEGVVGAYYPDGRVNLALTPGGDVAVGRETTPRLEERKPKPSPGGPPSPEDPWSKARNVGFEFGIDWEKTFQHGNQPLTPDDIRQQMEQAP